MAINNAQESNDNIMEGKLTQSIEKQTAKIPSVGYLSLAVGSILLSAGLAVFAEKKTMANFVGLWVPTFLLFGIYNKLVKLEGGSDHLDKSSNFSSGSSSRGTSSISDSRLAI